MRRGADPINGHHPSRAKFNAVVVVPQFRRHVPAGNTGGSIAATGATFRILSLLLPVPIYATQSHRRHNGQLTLLNPRYRGTSTVGHNAVRFGNAGAAFTILILNDNIRASEWTSESRALKEGRCTERSLARKIDDGT